MLIAAGLFVCVIIQSQDRVPEPTARQDVRVTWTPPKYQEKTMAGLSSAEEWGEKMGLGAEVLHPKLISPPFPLHLALVGVTQSLERESFLLLSSNRLSGQLK